MRYGPPGSARAPLNFVTTADTRVIHAELRAKLTGGFPAAQLRAGGPLALSLVCFCSDTVVLC